MSKIRDEPTIKLSLCDALDLMRNVRVFADPEAEMRLTQRPDGYWMIEVLNDSCVWIDATEPVLEIAVKANSMIPPLDLF
jgi:hypothetical protein